MKAALKFKKWLSLADAANNLSSMLEDDVQIQDILQLGIDLHLKLAVNFLREVPVLKVNIIPDNESVPAFQYLATEHLVDTNHAPPYQFHLSQDEEIVFFKDACNIVMMFGGMFAAKKACYLTENLNNIENPPSNILLEKNGEFYLLMEKIALSGSTKEMENEGSKPQWPVIKKLFKEINQEVTFTFASKLPPNTYFVVTKEAILEFESTHVTSDSKPLNVRLENNYLSVIRELALLIKDMNLKNPHKAAQLILESTNIKLGEETISGYISKANEIERRERE